MKYEVEQKFPVADLQEMSIKLEQLGARLSSPVQQRDRYFSHPARDFEATDEALRIRSVGQDNCITYKGPKLDPVTKTRREIELPLAAGDEHANDYAELLDALGFTAVAEVRKTRRYSSLDWNGMTVDVALDEVDRLGKFVELEISADEHGLDQARSSLKDLAERLELVESERRGYLQLLLATDA